MVRELFDKVLSGFTVTCTTSARESVYKLTTRLLDALCIDSDVIDDIESINVVFRFGAHADLLSAIGKLTSTALLKTVPSTDGIS